ncbi:MAG: hypothetical protein JOZ78_18515 [Chroococcidiopsidaceae cyanobacterium CP_BM_ER_R8_30]|nr:hypothetical protein [Chroococcidiopsidaceae cyanobacterium CP_BM_ER_R8_30]
MLTNLTQPISLTLLVAGLSFTNSLISPVDAATPFTDQTSFVNSLQTGFYLNNFEQLTPGDTGATNISFAQNGFSYNIADNFPSNPGNLFVIQVNGGSQALSTFFQTDPVIINFTSGNVTAVGGNFFLTDVNNNPIAGNLTINLNDGTSVTFSSSASTNFPFEGFTTTGSTFITSLALGGVGFGQFNTIDNLYVGKVQNQTVTVPEPSFVPGLFGFAALFGIMALRSRQKSVV